MLCFVGWNAASGLIFRNGLHAYLAEHAFGNAQTADLWAAMTAAAKETVVCQLHCLSLRGLRLFDHDWCAVWLQGVDLDVGSVMDTWTSQLGFPLLNVSFAPGGQVIEMAPATTRFVAYPPDSSGGSSSSSQQEQPQSFAWKVPVTYRRPGADVPDQWWLDGADPLYLYLPDAPAEWVKVNADDTAFARVQYGEANMAALSRALLAGNMTTWPLLPLSVNDRQQLLSDAFALADAGLHDVRLALEASRFLAAERSYSVWATALRALRRVAGLMADSESYGDMARYLRSRMEPAVRELGWNDTGTPHTQQLLRSVLYALIVRLGHRLSRGLIVALSYAPAG